MKSILRIIYLIFIFLSTSCIEQDGELLIQELDTKTDAEIIKNITESGQEGIPYPEGSSLRMSDGDFEIRLPKGYFFVLQKVKSDGETFTNLLFNPSLGVTCTCSKGSGCSPVKYDGQYYCVMNSGCTTCTMSTTTPDGVDKSSVSEVLVRGLINKNAGITFISDAKIPAHKNGDLVNLEKLIRHKEVIHGNAFEELFEIAEVKTYFDNITKLYKEKALKPNKYAYMNIYGNLALIPYYLEAHIIEVDGVKYSAKSLKFDSSEVSCSCSKGNGCIKKSVWIPGLGTAHYCEAGSCTSCTLKDNKAVE
ncbi:MAG: hypothetical protein NW226_27195 [Microscillaceae bacterium]|nr:hypothetical protein [Microscillaceae bacterium]